MNKALRTSSKILPIFLSVQNLLSILLLFAGLDNRWSDEPLGRLGDLRRVAGMRFNFDSDQPTLLDIEVGQAADEVNNSK